MSQCQTTNNNSIHIDINITSICNIACTYCSEGNECGLSSLYLKNTQVKVQDLIKALDKNPNKQKTINFWGGEPFINFDYIKTIIEYYKNNKDYSFFFYTNGILVPNYIDILKKWNEEFGKEKGYDGQSRLIIQISYDGKYLTDNIRVDKTGKGTADKVEKAFRLLKENNIETSLKSVISHEGFDHLYDSFLDCYNLQGFYNPTPDLWSDRTEEEFQEDLKVIEEQLSKIAAYIIENNLNPDVFSWFGRSRAICSVGSNMISIDLDGSLYACHALQYQGRKEHRLGHLDNFNEVQKKTAEIYKVINGHLPEECQKCDVNYCMKCQAASYDKSKKESYHERFTDYQANWQVCRLFKVNDKYNKTVRYMVEENKGGL